MATLTHEVFHCYQVQLAGVERYDHDPDWLMEGSANWVACQLVGAAGDWTGWYKDYLETPETDLFTRTYAAMGFFAQAWDSGANLWQRWQAAFSKTSEEDAYGEIVGAQEPALLDTWGASFLRQPARGSAWDARAPCIPADSAAPFELVVLKGSSRTVHADLHSAGLWSPSSETGALTIAVTGKARISSSHGSLDIPAVDGLRLCTDEGRCACPDDPTTEPDPPLTSAPGAVLALTSSANPSTAIVTALDLEKLCKHKRRPLPGPPPSPNHAGTGVSNGDPHISTFDGGGYGFQTAGEFTLVKSTVDDREIQSRQVPYPSTLYPALARSLAMNTAFAMRDGGAIVEVEKGSRQVLYIDRQRQFARNGQTIGLPGGGRVRYGNTQTVVTWRDGTTARVFSIGDEGVNIAVKPSRSHAGLLTGLLGCL